MFYAKKKWKIVTTRPMLIEVMAPYARIPEHFVGRSAQFSAERLLIGMQRPSNHSSS